jgi:hypothetical protein
MPFADLSEFEKAPSLDHLGDLFTVDLITRYIRPKVGAAEYATRLDLPIK